MTLSETSAVDGYLRLHQILKITLCLFQRSPNGPEYETTDESDLLPTLAKSLTRFGKETVRTGVGEFVPATGRNLALEGSSALIDHFTKPADQSASRKQMFVEVPAGQEFYLMVLHQDASSDNAATQPASVDQLLEKLARKRLGE